MDAMDQIKITYTGNDNTALTRSLASLSEQHLMPPRLRIWRDGDAWFMELEYDERPPDSFMRELDFHTDMYGAHKIGL